jgi:uroporphyrinogen-III synthase
MDTFLPLHGRRIVITRAREQAASLVARLRDLGAEPVLCPAIAFAPPDDPAPLDNAIARLADYDWLIVTSANGARALFDRMADLHADPASLQRLSIAAIGPATAAALAEQGLAATFMPTAYVAEAILDEIGDVTGSRVLLPRADIARETLAAGLRAKGAQVDEITAYRTVPGDGAAALLPMLHAGSVDAITFTSSSTVRYLLDGLEIAGLPRARARALISCIAVVCIGPITAATARNEGLPVSAEAPEYTTEGVVAALVDLFQRQRVV